MPRTWPRRRSRGPPPPAPRAPGRMDRDPHADIAGRGGAGRARRPCVWQSRHGPPVAGHPRPARARRRPRTLSGPSPSTRPPKLSAFSARTSRARVCSRATAPSGGGTRVARRKASWRRSQDGAPETALREMGGVGVRDRARPGRSRAGGRCPAPPELELLDPIPERAAGDPEPGGGPGDVPVGLTEGLEEMLPLDGAHRVAERGCGRTRGSRRDSPRSGRRGQPQGVRGHQWRLREKGHTLHHVHQLSDVPRPAIGESAARASGVRVLGPRR